MSRSIRTSKLVVQASDSPWSSARAHLAGRDDGPVRVALLIDRVGRFADLMTADTDVSLFAALRDAEGKRLIDVDIEPPLHFFLLRRDGLYDLAAQRYLV